MFRKPDNRSTQEKLADSKAKREAAQAIGRKDKPRKK